MRSATPRYRSAPLPQTPQAVAYESVVHVWVQVSRLTRPDLLLSTCGQRSRAGAAPTHGWVCAEGGETLQSRATEVPLDGKREAGTTSGLWSVHRVLAVRPRVTRWASDGEWLLEATRPRRAAQRHSPSDGA